MGSRRRAQSPSSVNKTSQWQLACVFRHAHPAARCGYKRRARANAQQFFASEPSLPQSPECLQSSQHWCYGASAEVAVQCCREKEKAFFGGHAASSPGHFSASKREFRRAKRAPRATGVFLKMASRLCVSGCGHFLASSDGHDRCPSCLSFQHAEAALVNESCFHCGNMTMAMLRSRYLLARRGGIPLALPHSSSSGLRRTTSAQGQGDLRIIVRASPSSTSPQASHSSSTSHRLVFPDERAGSSDRAGLSISFGAPADDRMSITASGDGLGSGEDDSAALPPSGRVALPESDPELIAMLSRAAESIGLLYRLKPPSPECSRLDDWFLGRRPNIGNRLRFLSSRKCMRRWLGLGGHLFLPETGLVPPPSSPPLTVERPKGMWKSPSAAVPALTAKAYSAAGQAASALHAMALLQVHQSKALKQLRGGDADPGVLQELRTAMDLALRATKVTTRALGQTMSTLVVQERHLWLTLADTRESDKHRFLDSPISQAGLFGEAVEDFAQQFSAAQKQTEAFHHISQSMQKKKKKGDAWSLSSARERFHWNIFRGSWGIWHPQPLSRRSDCFIWDRFSVGFTTESRDGHGATAHTGSHSPRPATAPSAHVRTLLFFGQEFP